MRNYIEHARIDIHNGTLAETLSFLPGLNLISGENGTLKTRALQALKNSGDTKNHDPSQYLRRQSISPKRNAQRRAFQQVFEHFRRSNIKLEALTNERNINDGAFEEYPALGDLYYVVFEALCRDGGDQVERMHRAAEEFNSVIRQIFPHYQLVAKWNKAAGSPDIQLLKRGRIEVPLEGLSLGEQEILSLAANIHSSRSRYDVFLIDEPEVHLNWHLEERLFEFFDSFCEQEEKQMIVVTHSRVVFKERFLPKTQFFTWKDDGRVACGREMTPEQRRRLAGEAIEIVRLGEFGSPTMFVEDDAHVIIMRKLLDLIGARCVVTKCGSKENVRSLYRLSTVEGGWSEALFLEDGDNEGNPFPKESRFIHMDKYCLEAYLLDIGIASSVANRSEAEIKAAIFGSIMKNSDKIFKKNRFFEFLVGFLKEEHITPERLDKLDASLIMNSYLNELGLGFHEYVDAFLSECVRQGRLEQVFGGRVIEAVRTLQTRKMVEIKETGTPRSAEDTPTPVTP